MQLLIGLTAIFGLILGACARAVGASARMTACVVVSYVAVIWLIAYAVQ